MKYYIIAGEASGDLHGSNLISELKKLDPQSEIRAWGGDLMTLAGAHLVKHYRDLAFMGFIEVIKNLPAIFRNLKLCKKDILQFDPDVLILIDYPGFNLRIAQWAKEQRLRIVYYISPQVWAWKEGRVKSIKKIVDKMLVILPFEEKFYKRWNYKVEYVGHPLVQVVDAFDKRGARMTTYRYPDGRLFSPGDRPRIALLPGSRKQEIQLKLPVMLETSNQFPQYDFIVAQAPGQSLGLYLEMLTKYTNVDVALEGQAYTLLSVSAAALVTSGTATLETALFGVPQVVCYKGSSISYQIAKRLVRVKYISLVNLIMDKPVVTELIQDELTVPNLARELDLILHDQDKIRQMREQYTALKTLLQKEGDASAKAASIIVNLISGEEKA